MLASCVVAASCRDETTANVWDAQTLNKELLDHMQIIFVDGGFGQRFQQQLTQRGIQTQVPTGVLK